MGEEEQNPNSIYIPHELLEEIVIRLPSKSIQKWRTVSKQWRSILGSRRFRDKHMSLPKSRKILAAYNCDCGGRLRPLPDSESRFKGDEEIVYIHCDAARLSLTCDGLVCFLEHDWIIVLNPSTRQLRRFPSGLTPHHTFRFVFGNNIYSLDIYVFFLESNFGTRKQLIKLKNFISFRTLAPFPSRILVNGIR